MRGDPLVINKSQADAKWLTYHIHSKLLWMMFTCTLIMSETKHEASCKYKRCNPRNHVVHFEYMSLVYMSSKWISLEPHTTS